MKEDLFIVLLLGSCLAQKTLVTADSKELVIQIGAIDEFILNQGYPFKKKSDSRGSNFKIIIDH